MTPSNPYRAIRLPVEGIQPTVWLYQGFSLKSRVGWQKASGDNMRSQVAAAIRRYKQVIGDGLRFRKDGRRATEVGVAVRVLNQMLELGRPTSVRIA
jgi:hypothetical protein